MENEIVFRMRPIIVSISRPNHEQKAFLTKILAQSDDLKEEPCL